MLADIVKTNTCGKRTRIWFTTWGGPPNDTPAVREPEHVVRLYTGAKRYGYAQAHDVSSVITIHGVLYIKVDEIIRDLQHVIKRIALDRKDAEHRRKTAASL